MLRYPVPKALSSTCPSTQPTAVETGSSIARVLYSAACSVMDFLRATHVQCSRIAQTREGRLARGRFPILKPRQLPICCVGPMLGRPAPWWKLLRLLAADTILGGGSGIAFPPFPGAPCRVSGWRCRLTRSRRRSHFGWPGGFPQRALSPCGVPSLPGWPGSGSRLRFPLGFPASTVRRLWWLWPRR